MSKVLDFQTPVSQLIAKYPALKEVLISLGFTQLQNPLMLKTAGKFMTLEKGIAFMKLDPQRIQAGLENAGFTIVKGEEDLERRERVNTIKEYLQRVNDGESLEKVQADFNEKFANVDSGEIMQAEQEILESGTPIEEVQKLCDIHSSLFHDCVSHEAVSLPSYEIADHPLHILHLENIAIQKLLHQADKSVANGQSQTIDTKELKKIASHYHKKGDLIYPLLKNKYHISGPSDVMWGVDIEIRTVFSILDQVKKREESWNQAMKENLKRAKEMVFKEENILFPRLEECFSTEDWKEIAEDMKNYPQLLLHESDFSEKAPVTESTDKEEMQPSMPDLLRFTLGQLSPLQVEALLNTLPMEITFVDHNDINRYYNDNGKPKVFQRPKSSLNREVYECHPAKVRPMVQGIIEDFKLGKKDTVSVWRVIGDKNYFIQYLAVRDKAGLYYGTLEWIMDMDFAKDHFSK